VRFGSEVTPIFEMDDQKTIGVMINPLAPISQHMSLKQIGGPTIEMNLL
jgi:hypothetical protein